MDGTEYNKPQLRGLSQKNQNSPRSSKILRPETFNKKKTIHPLQTGLIDLETTPIFKTVSGSKHRHVKQLSRLPPNLPNLEPFSPDESYALKQTRDLSGIISRTTANHRHGSKPDVNVLLKTSLSKRQNLPGLSPPPKKDHTITKSKQKFSSTFTGSMAIAIRLSSIYNKKKRYASSPKANTLHTNITKIPVLPSGQKHAATSNIYLESQLAHQSSISVSGMSSHDRTLFNLFNSMYIRSDAKCVSFKPKVFIGKGNNSKIVGDVIARRQGLLRSGTIGGSQIVWTCLDHKDVQKTNVSSAVWIDIDDVNRMQEYKKIDIYDVGKLISQLIRLNLFIVRNVSLIKDIFDNIIMKKSIHMIYIENLFMPNHIKGSIYIGRKSLLTESLILYFTKMNKDPFSVIPRTFIIKYSNYDADMKMIRSLIQAGRGYSYPLIIKPGENANRGTGISIAYKDQDLLETVSSIFSEGGGPTPGLKKTTHSVLVQNYIVSPLLYKSRKFDMRCYALAVRTFDRVSFYWYTQGYARTSSYAYNVNNRDNLMVHLTNEAVQVQSKFFSSCR